METMPVATRNYVRLENGRCHITVVNQIGKGEGMCGSQIFTPKSTDFDTPIKYSTRIFPKREHF
jgi:hypothetical protein